MRQWTGEVIKGASKTMVEGIGDTGGGYEVGIICAYEPFMTSTVSQCD